MIEILEELLIVFNYVIIYLNSASLEQYKNDIFIPEYITSIKGICAEIIKDQSPAKLKQLREAFLKLLINGVPTDIIVLNMIRELCTKAKTEDVKRQIISWGCYYDNRYVIYLII